MTDIQEQIEDTVAEVTKRAYEQAIILYGREPNGFEVAIIQFQAQLSMLTAALFEDEEQLQYWKNVVAVIQGGKPNGSA